MVRPVAALADVQGALSQRQGQVRPAKVTQDRGEDAEPEGDIGVVIPVGGLGKGHGALEQEPGIGQPGVHPQVGSRPVQQPGCIVPCRGIDYRGGIEVSCGGQHVR